MGFNQHSFFPKSSFLRANVLLGTHACIKAGRTIIAFVPIFPPSPSAQTLLVTFSCFSPVWCISMACYVPQRATFHLGAPQCKAICEEPEQEALAPGGCEDQSRLL